MAQHLIKLENVTKRFVEDETKVGVLDNISFEVNRNEFISIVGPSGCGKTTVLRMMAGLEKPSSGNVLFEGREIEGPDPRRSALIFQTFALLPWRSVAENVELGLQALEIPKEKRQQIVDKYVNLMLLDDFKNAYPYELSGGMKQRVGIARALAVEPSVLLMDEPFSALDALTASTLRSDVLRIWRDKRHKTNTFVMVTHLIDEAIYMSDRVIVLSKRPSHVIADVSIDMPRPREKYERHEQFFKASDDIRALIEHSGQQAAAAGGTPTPMKINYKIR